MKLIERLARDLCTGLMINPDEMVQDPRAPELGSNLSFVKNEMVPRWVLFVKAIPDMLLTLRDNPTELMVEQGNVGIRKVARLADPQAQVPWRYMLSELLWSIDYAQVPEKKESSEVTPVLQDWVSTISRRQQGVLILALRGPDGVPKEHGAKNAVRIMRACVMNSGREGKPMEMGQRYETDSFMRMDLFDTIDGIDHWEGFVITPFFNALDSYNIHFYTHFIHAAAVLGFNHPHQKVRKKWLEFYHKGCDNIHMNPETEERFKHRLRDGIREGE